MNSKEKKREGRIALHRQNRIGIKTKSGMMTRLVNDEGDNVSRFKRAGWTPVYKEVLDGKQSGDKPTQEGVIATQDVGNGIKGIYMEIPKKYWEKDQAEKQKACDRTMEQIGQVQAGMLPDRPYNRRIGTIEITESLQQEESS